MDFNINYLLLDIDNKMSLREKAEAKKKYDEK